MDTIDEYKKQFNILVSKHPFIKDLSSNYDKNNILFSDLDNPVSVKAGLVDKYRELFAKHPKPNNLTILMNDLINIDTKDPNIEYHYNYASGISININKSQWQKVILECAKQTPDNYVLEKADIEEYKTFTINNLHDVYSLYGKYKGKFQSIKDMNKYSRIISMYDIKYMNPYIREYYGDYDNFKLIIEVRNLQIHIYHTIYVEYNKIYDSITSLDKSKMSDIDKIKEINKIRITLKSIIERKILELESKIILKYEKMELDTDNNIAKIFKKDRAHNVYYYRMFIDNILNDDVFKKDIEMLFSDKLVKINYILDEAPIIKYLYEVYNLIGYMDKDKILKIYPNTSKETIEKIENNNTKINIISKLVRLYITQRQQEKNINPETQRLFNEIFIKAQAILPDITHILSDKNMNRQIFLLHKIVPEVQYLYDENLDQTNLDQMYFSKRTHPKFRNIPEYNILCDLIDPSDKDTTIIGQSDNLYIEPVIGLHDDINNHINCNSLFISSPQIYLFNNKLNTNIYNLCMFSRITNNMVIYVGLHKKKERLVRGLYKKSMFPKRYVVNIQNENLLNFTKNVIYIGLLLIQTTTHKIILIKTWNIKEKQFILYEILGNQLSVSEILYRTVVTYGELLSIKYQDFDLYKKIQDNLIEDTYYLSKMESESKLTIPNIETKKVNVDTEDKKNIKLIGGNIDNKYFHVSRIKNIEFISEVDEKINTKYYKIKRNIEQNIFKQLSKDEYRKFIKLTDKYNYLYNREIKLIDRSETKFNDKNTLIKTSNILNNSIKYIINNINNDNILNYKFISIQTLCFWEINKIYNLINNKTKNICIISNEYFNDAIKIIKDNINPLYENEVKTFYIPFIIDKTRKIYVDEVYELNKFHPILINTNEDITYILDKNMKINTDFLYIDIRENLNWDLYNLKMHELYLLNIICCITNKLNIKSNACIVIPHKNNKLTVKILTLLGYLFEEVYIYSPECNPLRLASFFCIFKNKKEVKKEYIEELHKLRKKIILPNIEEIDVNKPELINHIKIKLRSKELIRLKKEITNKLIYTAKRWFITGCNILNELQELVDKDIFNDPIYEKYIENRKKQNLYECIMWAKKYDMPLMPQYDFADFSISFKHKIFRDIVSYEKNIKFKFKKEEENMSNKIILTNLNRLIKENIVKSDIDYNDIPEYFSKILSKFNLETRALDYRDMANYKEVNLKVDYYQKKLTKIITTKYKLYDGFITQAWFKMTEMLNTFNLVPKNINKDEEFKTFHICELPGAFIKALQFYIDRHENTNIKKNWKWKAQSLNPLFERLTKDNLNVAFGDSAGLVKKNPDKYDFGYNGSGDITDVKNIEYYKQKYPDNDFITADCGLPSENKDLSGKLTLSTYLLIFALLKKGGNCLIKKIMPIDNQQNIILLYIFYLSFEKMYFYKPRVNQQSPEYYLIGINYTPIPNNLFETLLEFLKDYKKIGLIKFEDNNDNIYDFLLQIDKAQHLFIGNINDFIRKKIYFADTHTEFTENDWLYINKGIKDKIVEWLSEFKL